jgi:hypothetical protein
MVLLKHNPLTLLEEATGLVSSRLNSNILHKRKLQPF